jgi:hypothetical protein
MENLPWQIQFVILGFAILGAVDLANRIYAFFKRTFARRPKKHYIMRKNAYLDIRK